MAVGVCSCNLKNSKIGQKDQNPKQQTADKMTYADLDIVHWDNDELKNLFQQIVPTEFKDSLAADQIKQVEALSVASLLIEQADCENYNFYKLDRYSSQIINHVKTVAKTIRDISADLLREVNENPLMCFISDNNIFHVQTGDGDAVQHFLLAPSMGVFICCTPKDRILYPEKIYLVLMNKGIKDNAKGGNPDAETPASDIEFSEKRSIEIAYSEPITIQREEDKTIFLYKDSKVVFNNATMQTAPFVLNECRIDVEQVWELSQNCFGAMGLPIKYFWDCYAAQSQGANIVYFNEGELNPNFDVLHGFYIHLYSDSLEEMTRKLKAYQDVITNAKQATSNAHPQDLYLMKIFADCPRPADFKDKILSGGKHAMLLMHYKNKWYILDPNGAQWSDFFKRKLYVPNAQGSTKNIFLDALKKTNITIATGAPRGSQKFNGCDEGTSFLMAGFAHYNARNNKDFSSKLTQKGNAFGEALWEAAGLEIKADVDNSSKDNKL